MRTIAARMLVALALGFDVALAAAQPAPIPMPLIDQVLEQAERERTLALVVLDDIISHDNGYFHATLGERAIDIEVDSSLNGDCRFLGNPAVSFMDGRTYRIRLCLLGLSVTQQAARGMNHLTIEAAQHVPHDQIDKILPAWKKKFFEAQVRHFSARRTEALNGSPVHTNACDSAVLVAYLVVHDRPTTECETAEAALLSEARNWARGHYKQIAQKLAAADDNRDALEIEIASTKKWVLSYVIAHEIGHLLPKPPLSARPADNKTPERLMTEMVADSYVMHTPSEGTDLVMDTLSALWSELLQQGRPGAPELEHVMARKNAMDLFALCRQTSKTEPVQSRKDSTPDDEAICLALRAAFGGGSPQLLEQLDPSRRSNR